MKLSKYIIVIFLLLYGSICYGEVRNIGEPYRFDYSILNETGTFVSGQTPEISICKTSNNYFYDFNDSTFKQLGWTTKYKALTEDTTNYTYFYSFVPPSTETSSEQYLFFVRNLDSSYRDSQNIIVSYQNVNFNFETDSVTTSSSDKLDLWNTSVVSFTGSGYTFGDYIVNVIKYTNGVKDDGVFNGIENLIRSNR